MDFCFSQHWNLEHSRPVYQTGGKKKVEVKSEVPGKGAEPVLPEPKYAPGKSHGDLWDLIKEKYGKTAYEALISDYVTRIMPRSPDGYKGALLSNSSGRYMVFYERIKGIFMNTAVDLEEKFEYSVDRIQKKTRTELAVLKSAVEGTEDLINFKEAMPSPKNSGEVEDHFDDYLDALNGRYFNADVNEGIKIPDSGIPVLRIFLNPDEKVLDPKAYPKEKSDVPVFGVFTGSDALKGIKYNEKSTEFQNKMETWVDNKLAWLLKQKGTTKRDLEAFKQEIANRYKLCSMPDGNSTIISGVDLPVLEAYSKPPPNAARMILEETDADGMRRLEAMQLLNPSGWEDNIEIAGNVIVQAAVNNGSEEDFVKAMKKYKNVADFDKAVSEFNDMLDEISKVGVRETLGFLQKFNNDVHREVLKFQNKIDPSTSFGYQVRRQLDYLLSGTLVPHKDIDKMLVRFMNSNREERNEILAHPGTRDVLFRAISMATRGYPKKYDEKYKKVFTGKTKYKENIETTTTHDRAAQLQALIILGKQSRVIVDNLTRTPEHAGKKYIEEIDAIKVPEAKAIELGLRFKSPRKRARFRSNLAMGGFDTGTMLLQGTKMLAALSVVSNFAQSYSEAKGEDFVDKLLNAAEGAASNPSLWISAAVGVGAHMALRHPLFLKYPWLSQHQRAGLMTAFKLDNIGARLGKTGHLEVKRFLFNNAEWRALKHPNMSGEKIRGLLKEKGKKAKGGRKPVITVEDLSKIIKDESIISTLTRKGRSPRMRYLFYQKFFGRTPKPDVHQVKEHCTGSSHVSSSPVKTA